MHAEGCQSDVHSAGTGIELKTGEQSVNINSKSYPFLSFGQHTKYVL